MTFDKNQGEHELKSMALSHNFSLKMASLICWSVVAIVIIFGICSVQVITPFITGTILALAIVLGVITFGVTRSACA